VFVGTVTQTILFALFPSQNWLVVSS